MNKKLANFKFLMIIFILVFIIITLCYLNLSIGLIDSTTMEQIYDPNKVLMFVF